MNIIEYDNENNIYNNCMLTMIAHSIMARKYPELNYEFSWDEVTFNINNSQGCRGSISFCKNATVGFFQDISIINNETIPSVILKNITEDFPEEIMDIANNEALLYLLDDNDESEIASPLVTTGFYVDGEHNIIHTNDEYNDFIKNGSYCIENQLKSFDDTYNYLLKYYEMDNLESELLLKIYKLKINSEEQINLSSEIRNILKQNFSDSIEFTVDSFSQINIIL